MHTRKGSALSEVVWVVMAVVVLAAVACPMLATVQSDGASNTCQGNLKKILRAMDTYAAEYNGILPLLESSDGKYWMDRLDRYTETTREERMKYDASTPYHCPTALETHPGFKKTNGSTYGVNGYCLSSQYFVPEAGEWVDMDVVPSMKLPRIKNPGDCMIFSDGHWSTDSWGPAVDVNYWACPEFNHDGGANVVFFDGHSRCVKRSEVPGQCRDPFWWPFGMRK